MKKLLLAIVVVFIVFWIGSLAFISNPLIVSSVVYAQGQASKVNTIAMTLSGWEKWWPAHSSFPKYRNYTYQIIHQTPLSVQILAKDGKDTFTSEITVLPVTLDSSTIQWKTELATSLNPFTRLQQYNRATSIKHDFQLLLDSLAAYLNDRKKMYGMDITITNFTNPFMLSTQAQFTHYPSVNEVYQTIDELRTYARAGGAMAVDSPMVNIEGADDAYLLRTALPINKKLVATTTIDFKQMVLGKTLLSTVAGGRQTVEKSLQSMQDFISDYRLTSPAIPFQLWVTNRQQQPDSTQWMTRLYYPVF